MVTPTRPWAQWSKAWRSSSVSFTSSPTSVTAAHERSPSRQVTDQSPPQPSAASRASSPPISGASSSWISSSPTDALVHHRALCLGVGDVDRGLPGLVGVRVDHLLAGVGRIGQGGGQALVAAVGHDAVDQRLAQLVRRGQHLDQHRRDGAEVEPLAQLELLGVGLELLVVAERGLVGGLDPAGVALDDRAEPERHLVLGVVVLGAVEVVVLVVERVRQLVGDGRADVGGEPRAPDHQRPGLGVVEADHPGAQQRLHGFHQVEAGRDQPQRGVEHLLLLDDVEVVVEVVEQPSLEVALAQQLHRDRVLERLALPPARRSR
jgi:hypothetical protein